MDNSARVTGWWVFAGTLLAIAGFLNIIYGIAAIGNSKFFTPNTVYIWSDLNTWGWITLIIGVVQLSAAGSLFAGNTFGRVIGIIAASLSAIAALMTIPAQPFWSICIFSLSVIVIHQLSRSEETA
ncbi:MAG: hypothetical protein JHC87_07290 [Thermoleophilaceae bacterium]|nr:hypothetical protein [Thermoleophilaceae bacterium]